VGVSSQNLGCNSSSVWGDKLPSVFTNVREPAVLQWIRDYAVSDLVITRRSRAEDSILLNALWGILEQSSVSVLTWLKEII